MPFWHAAHAISAHPACHPGTPPTATRHGRHAVQASRLCLHAAIFLKFIQHRRQLTCVVP